MKRFRGNLTYANVMSTLAVFLVLSGGAALAAGLGKDSVKSKQIKAGAVKTAELADNAVTSPKVANGSLLGEDFAAGQLPAGAQGPKGDQGLQGPPGSDAQLNGAAAGGDLTGSFPNPTIGPNAVSGAEVANGTLGAADIAVVSGIWTSNLPPLAPGACTFDTPGSDGASQPGDVVLVGPNSGSNFWASSSTPLNYTSAVDGFFGGQVFIHICNQSTTATIDPPSTTWRYIVLR